MRLALEERRSTDSFRSLLPSDSSLTDFCSNDYLGLARSPEFYRMVQDEWERFLAAHPLRINGSGGSRLLAGDSRYAHETEEEIAAFYKAETALLFNSGYAANTGIFSCLPARGDTVLYDELIHASVRDGIRLSPAKAWSFRHNDLAHLEELLIKAEGLKYVAAESIYSMDGDEVPLGEITGLCEKYGAHLILDEAHSNGLYGRNGEGIAVAAGLQDRVFARIYTFGKAGGAHGAAVAGSDLLRDYLVNFSRPFIYSTALPPHDLALIRSAVRYFPQAENLRQELQRLLACFRKRFSAYDLLASGSAIQALLCPGNSSARNLASICRKAGFDLRAVLSPTVPAGKERIRIIVHAFNTDTEIDQLVKIIGESI